ncbi:sugar ABC transporter substrate-binding protein [Rhizobium lentis]|uniref:Sugar ABC transporter substrate-binding protein n=1 Tax=Rhizobium lentis TaxID=1138194 RepID=A0A9Q3QWZ8_9HYPH|nr:sugar ABC transporter substrate-binding protein [Rhizobium lentis]MBX4958732.1 sugar ABC transporter substrate-binding protein [Rhizobium lentis]MBX4976888.1 sugar ABC transporter substrate-binding protein [Rhizobium lentis]MBX4988714.1 sugar ABC transporter substrate-binding protein [Rhizobium lentis]MBX5007163.1 sugar ABC transporter substrate-binding protein [Rhizobium lentis]MBX5012585.1 sugar ABC transporter substrate-binding protein [Rhizobium lentis]
MKVLKKTLLLAAIGGSLFATSASAEQVNLTWQMWTGSEADTKSWQHLADMVTAKYPDIKVTLTTTGWVDYWTRLPVLAASGQLADIVSMQSLRMPNFYSLLEPLNDRIAADKFDIGAFTPSIIGGMSVDKQLYGLPYDVGPWVIYYNVDAIQAAGIPLPKPGWTLAEFTDAAKKLTKDGKYGFGITPQNYSVLASAWGDKYVNDAGELDLTNPSAIAAAERVIGFAAKDKVAPLVPSSADVGTVIQGRFNSGNVAMYVDGPWSIIGMKDKAKFKIGLTTLPRDDAKELAAVTAGSGFGISTTSKNKDAAWKAIQVLTSPEALQYLAEQGRALPARTASQASWYKVAAKDITHGGEALDYSLAHSVPYVITNNWAAVENLFNQYFPPAFGGSADAKQTMESIQSLAQQ